MSEPIRWRAPEGGASSEARDLLRHARAPRALDAAARARNAAAVTKIAAGPVATTTAVTAGTKALLGVGLASVMAVTAAVSGTRTRPAHEHHAPVAARTREAPPAPPYVPPAPAPRVASPDPVPHEVAPAPAPVRVAAIEPRREQLPSPAPRVAPVVALPSAPSPHVIPSQAAAPAAPVAPAAQSVPTEAPSAGSSAALATGTGGHVTPGSATVEDDPLVRETLLFEGVSGLIERDPGAALAQLDRHEREFPRGQLAAEREFFAVQALHRLGRDTDARARGDALIARFPTSPYAARTRRLLDGLP